MIANVVCVLAVASAAVAFPCTGVLNTGFGLSGNSGSCGSIGLFHQRPCLSGISSNSFVNTQTLPVINAQMMATGCNGNNQNAFGFGNNQNTFGFGNNQNTFGFGNNHGFNSGVNCGVNPVVSSSFGPSAFAPDTRAVGFANPRTGASCGSANANMVLGNIPVVSSQANSLNAAPTQVSVDAPVLSAGCGNQMLSSQGSGLFSTGSLAPVSLESGILSSGNQMLSGSNNGLFGRCAF